MNAKAKHRLFCRFIGSSWLVVLIAGLGLGGCEQEGSAEMAGKKIDKAVEKTGQQLERTGESMGASAAKAGEYMDDSAVTTQIKAAILSDPLLKVAQINVTTVNGVVKLIGVVDSQQSINRALQIVRSIPNVKSIDNTLVVKSP